MIAYTLPGHPVDRVIAALVLLIVVCSWAYEHGKRCEQRYQARARRRARRGMVDLTGTRPLGPSPEYQELLRGEITSDEYVASVKESVARRRQPDSFERDWHRRHR